ncbi:MAG: sigma 54-interacting transcriptional regulator [Bacteriovorax sp.]|nr:sigma 54-interacting transcriptional regulator [Bacteriovorax sp.]
MGALLISRSIIHSLESSIGLKGVREDDEFMLDLFQDRKRVFRLKRTKYKIVTSSKFYFDFALAQIHLPVFGSAQSEFELALVQHSGSFEYNEKSRYLMKSLGESPFRLNGVQCFEAFVERGDVIDIGFNRIQFLRPRGHLKISEKPHFTTDLLSEEMIKSPLNIMIEGETGTGKTTLAKSIHEESARSGRFIHLNLSSFAPSLIESELFGHVKGAFTGAITEKRGAILEAHKGTLFLDEIDSLSIELQTKLLLFLDNYEVRAVGGSATQKADVRLIFASGTKMKQLIERQKMRKDFYYRLTSGVVVTLGNLRDNPIKIREFCMDFEKQNLTILCEDLIKYYQECPWPGNFRQLLSHLNKKKILSLGKKIILDHLDHDLINEKAEALGFEAHQLKSLEEIKMDYCLNIFMKTDKNFVRAAKLLDISPNTLKALLGNRDKLKKSRDHEVVDINL